MGMWLPDKQVPFFAKNFNEVQVVLADGLSHRQEDVRQRAAYVVEELGGVASPLEATLRERVQDEPSRIVRLYLYNALRAIAADSEETLEVLRSRFKQLGSLDESAAEDYYTAIDERIYVAAALFVLDDGSDRRQDFLHAVLTWLDSPPSDLSANEHAQYWQHRWCAVNAVEHMHGAQEAIPLLEAMLEEIQRKPWVPVHVPRALKSLRADSGP